MMRALVVDDDQDTRVVLRLMLEDASYTVAEAADGIQTLDALRTSVVPMVVLLDLDLPGIDGIAVLRAVADDAHLAARHAFILLTAVQHSRYQAAADVCETLSVPLILKPFNMDTLLDAVATAARHLPPTR
ncbi:MAG TPA: response regulator [Ktedonobacterales bacterium]|jgi:CheY-like chemotaxis protein|nr:response regulator [Ktedonobacterales bacterium]